MRVSERDARRVTRRRPEVDVPEPWGRIAFTLLSRRFLSHSSPKPLILLRTVLPDKVVHCLSILVAGGGMFRSDAALDNLTGFGTGVMLFANIPIMLIFGAQAMRAYRTSIAKLRAGAFQPTPRRRSSTSSKAETSSQPRSMRY